jgi:hypothetical protein
VHDDVNASFANFDSSRTSFYLVSFDYYLEPLRLEGDCVAALGSIGEYEGRPQMEILFPDTQLFSCN